MITREHIENFLRLNGISSDASDDLIRSALTKARWKSEEIELAITVLKGGEGEMKAMQVTANNFYQSDKKISSQTLSSLIGIDIELQRERIKEAHEEEEGGKLNSLFMVTVAVTTALALAAGLGFILMYSTNTGPFYDPVEQSSA